MLDFGWAIWLLWVGVRCKIKTLDQTQTSNVMIMRINKLAEGMICETKTDLCKSLSCTIYGWSLLQRQLKVFFFWEPSWWEGSVPLSLLSTACAHWRKAFNSLGCSSVAVCFSKDLFGRQKSWPRNQRRLICRPRSKCTKTIKTIISSITSFLQQIFG